MAHNVTLTELITELRNRGSLRAAFYPDAELTAYINDSLSALYDLMISQDVSYFYDMIDINVVANTRNYALPSDFYKVVGVAIKDPAKPDGYSVLQRYMYEERYDFAVNINKWTTRYEIRHGEIWFHPTPKWSESVRLEYIPTPPQLTSGSSTWDSVNAWTEWVITDVLIKCAAKEETDPQVWMLQKQRTEERIIQNIQQDRARPRRVTNVNRYGKYRWIAA